MITLKEIFVEAFLTREGYDKFINPMTPAEYFQTALDIGLLKNKFKDDPEALDKLNLFAELLMEHLLVQEFKTN